MQRGETAAEEIVQLLLGETIILILDGVKGPLLNFMFPSSLPMPIVQGCGAGTALH